MKPEILALYAGPNQIMVLPSILATISGLALMFWNKIVVFFGKIVNYFVRGSEADDKTSK